MIDKKLIIFDCDGVLIDSEIIAARVEAAAFTAIGYHLTPEEKFKKFLGKTEKDMFTIIESDLGMVLPEDFKKDLHRQVADAFANKLTAIKGITDILPKIPYKCVASNSRLQNIIRNFKTTGLDQYFEPNAIFSAEMVTLPKPAPDLFLHAARQMGYDVTDCIVIEDSPTGVRAASAANIPVIGFTGALHILNKDQHAQSLKNHGAITTFDHMRDLIDVLSAVTAL
jgi:HAD superfamily hydrolase (TIGR01509 family)